MVEDAVKAIMRLAEDIIDIHESEEVESAADGIYCLADTVFQAVTLNEYWKEAETKVSQLKGEYGV